ncbi:MAG: sugar-binding protein, partial [Pseudomonadota bacterium]
WSLREMRDPNNNFIKYHCVRVSDPGVAGGTVPGVNLYLQRITYTGSGVAEGPYTVTFIRDRDLRATDPSVPRRPDVQIDARGGFKRVTADLLRRVEVSLGAERIRHYEFGYNENPYGDNRPGTAFNKTLLTSVTQFGADGAKFNAHTFRYHDEARDASGGYKGFAATGNWTVGNDGVGAGLFGRGAASALGGSQSTSTGGHIYVGFGTDPNIFDKKNSGGLKVGFSRSTSETLLTLADLNGDGLPDKVYKGANGFHYRPNRSGPNGATAFGDPVPLPSLPAISREQVTSTTIGAESFFGLPVMGDVNRAVTQGDVYFTDVNGDGIIDLVSGGQVLFGYVNAAGVPTFSANSADTPVPIGLGAVHTANLLEDPSGIEAERA